MGAGTAGSAVQQPAIQDQKLKTRVCDKIVFCECLQTDYANLIMAIVHIAIAWQSAKLSSVSSPDGEGLRLPGAGERDPSRRDDKVGEVDVNRPVMVVEFYE